MRREADQNAIHIAERGTGASERGVHPGSACRLNRSNGTRTKTVLTEVGQSEIDVPLTMVGVLGQDELRPIAGGGARSPRRSDR